MLRYNVHTDEFKSRISDLSEKPQYTLALGAHTQQNQQEMAQRTILMFESIVLNVNVPTFT